MMNILLITRQFPPRLGGVATASLRLAKSLQKRGHTVTVVACNKHDQEPAFTATPISREHDSLPVYDIPEPLIKSEGLFFALSYLKTLTKKINPDIIHSYYIYPMSYIGQYLSGVLKIPHVASCRGDDITLSSLEKTGSVSLILKKVDQITSVSRSLLTWVELVSGRDNGIFVPNSIERGFLLNQAHFKEAIYSKYGLRQDSYIFAANAVFRWKKGSEYLKELLFHLAQSSLSNITFFLIGDFAESLESDLKKSFSVTEREDIFRQFISVHRPSRKELSQLLHVVDMFLLTSKREGMPNVLLEALSAGSAVAATKVDGAIDILLGEKNLGILLDRFSPYDASVQIVEYLVQNHHDRYYRQNHVNKFYDSDIEVSRYEKIYTEALKSSIRSHKSF